MPFLVDSVTMFLARHDHGIHLVVHPQLQVVRDVTGELRGLALGEPGDVDDFGAARESWMHVEIDRVEDAERLDALEQGLADVLRDVRESVEDWTKMQDRAMSVVADLRADPPPVPREEADEVCELLDWLARNHFTFVGYREYVLGEGEGDDGTHVLRGVPGTGLGHPALRPARAHPAACPGERDGRRTRSWPSSPRPTPARPCTARPTSTTSGSRASTTTATWWASGGSSACSPRPPTPSRSPASRWCGARPPACSAALGFQPMSHSGKALLDLLETYPRDDLFQTPVDELATILHAVLHLQERRQLRLFVRQDAYRRYLSCLVYLPRDRYTTQVREKMQTILAERARRHRARRRHRLHRPGQRVGAGPAALRGAAATR